MDHGTIGELDVTVVAMPQEFREEGRLKKRPWYSRPNEWIGQRKQPDVMLTTEMVFPESDQSPSELLWAPKNVGGPNWTCKVVAMESPNIQASAIEL